MQWWCSARTATWTWEWTAYPGVWLLVGVLALLYRRVALRHARGARTQGPAGPGPGARTGDGVRPRAEGAGDAAQDGGLLGPLPARKVAAFGAGLLLLWAALDWPVGPLAASYLASVHMAQLLVVSLVVPALLLLGLPDDAFHAWADRPVAGAVLRFLTHPVAALVVYNGVVVGSHVPAVLDTLSATQAGMVVMDLAWLAAGAVFWWPVLAPAPRREWFSPFFQMGYLFLNTLPVTVPYGFLVFAEFPVYATYELAPPFPGVSTVRDQRIAGLVMKVGGGLILWTAITVLFFRWWREEEGGPAGDGPARAPSGTPGG